MSTTETYTSGAAQWAAVDDYIARLLLPPDPLLEAVLLANAAAGLPAHDVSPAQGRFLQLLVRIRGAARILEIGTLGAYSTIWMARALPPGGRLITLEADPKHAEVALRNIAAAGLADQVELRCAPALESLAQLEAEQAAPFDLVFIDADKPNNPAYLEWALKFSAPGTVIIGDNVVREGAILDAESTDERIRGVRRFYELLAAEPRFDATALQTVGSKGYDGFALAVVR